MRMLAGHSLEEIHVHACRSQFGQDSCACLQVTVWMIFVCMLAGHSLEEIHVHACRSQFG